MQTGTAVAIVGGVAVLGAAGAGIAWALTRKKADAQPQAQGPAQQMPAGFNAAPPRQEPAPQKATPSQSQWVTDMQGIVGTGMSLGRALGIL